MVCFAIHAMVCSIMLFFDVLIPFPLFLPDYITRCDRWQLLLEDARMLRRKHCCAVAQTTCTHFLPRARALQGSGMLLSRRAILCQNRLPADARLFVWWDAWSTLPVLKWKKASSYWVIADVGGYIHSLEEFAVSVNYNCAYNLIDRYSFTEFIAELFEGMSYWKGEKKTLLWVESCSLHISCFNQMLGLPLTGVV